MAAEARGEQEVRGPRIACSIIIREDGGDTVLQTLTLDEGTVRDIARRARRCTRGPRATTPLRTARPALRGAVCGMRSCPSSSGGHSPSEGQSPRARGSHACRGISRPGVRGALRKHCGKDAVGENAENGGEVLPTTASSPGLRSANVAGVLPAFSRAQSNWTQEELAKDLRGKGAVTRGDSAQPAGAWWERPTRRATTSRARSRRFEGRRQLERGADNAMVSRSGRGHSRARRV